MTAHYLSEVFAAEFDADRVSVEPGMRVFLYRADATTDPGRGLSPVAASDTDRPGEIRRGYRYVRRRFDREGSEIPAELEIAVREPFTDDVLRGLAGALVVPQGLVKGFLGPLRPVGVPGVRAECVWRYRLGRNEDEVDMPVGVAPEGLPYSLPFTLA